MLWAPRFYLSEILASNLNVDHDSALPLARAGQCACWLLPSLIWSWATLLKAWPKAPKCTPTSKCTPKLFFSPFFVLLCFFFFLFPTRFIKLKDQGNLPIKYKRMQYLSTNYQFLVWKSIEKHDMMTCHHNTKLKPCLSPSKKRIMQ